MSNLAENLDNWNIDSDVEAERALQKIMQENAEAQRMINVCQTFINEYQAKIEQAKEELEKKTEWLKSQLANYMERVEVKTTKTQATYKLPSGTLKVKFGTPEYVRDEKKFLEWLKATGKNDFVKVKESPDWAEFKKASGVMVINSNVLTEDGEVIDGVTAVSREDKFEIEF